MEKSVLIEFFGDYPITRVLDFLIENRGLDYSKTDIAKGANVSWGTIYELWDKLIELEIIIETRRFGNTVLYKLNERNPFVKKLLDMELDLIKFYAEEDTKIKIATKRH